MNPRRPLQGDLSRGFSAALLLLLVPVALTTVGCGQDRIRRLESENRSLRNRIDSLERVISTPAGLLANCIDLRMRLDQQVRETEMWMEKTEQLKRQADPADLRRKMALDANLLLADIFPGPDSFNLTHFARDTLVSLASQLKKTESEIAISIYTDDADICLQTREKYPDALSYSSGKGVAVVKYLQSQGVPVERMTLIAHSTGREGGAVLPDLRKLASRMLVISLGGSKQQAK